MTCVSSFHNRESPAIYSTIFNHTCFQQTDDPNLCHIFNVPIINQGTIVYKQVWQCDGDTQCYEEMDELHCGFDTFSTLLIGN